MYAINGAGFRAISEASDLQAGEVLSLEFPEHLIGPPTTLEGMKLAAKARATQLRWECETGGVSIGDVQVGSTTEDQNRISSVLAAAGLGTVEQVDFKANSGWVTLTLAEIRGIAAAISAHVQACFTAERAHHEAIDAIGNIEELQAYDVAAGWPA
ncbi:DUF4376 domain-containing protein [Xanthomonas floridensis]|uniref:DUF4376 domain-containing protein n=1 Tax=Xanthomonas floridensis TaxID=1843580 RepID=A0A1A9MBP8_9XANT|nr:DUF4376 domain-containing protein [Xanthomonas floridensis]MEA5123318.1 DUF4376 domain-containing protein [Xanthomonas floridensis]MEA5132715.1 DUF4376 domain-containing protein [Xanthomonas floridensis]OAG67715.1 hypothetical protein A7D17_16130 [Xanthomonas floridensis]